MEIIEDASGDLDKADEVEQRVIEKLQGLGNEVLHDWAIYKENIKTNEYNQFTGFMRQRFDGSRAT